jgi:hypothetical protein
MSTTRPLRFLRVAHLENTDPDLLEGVPFYLEIAAFGVILWYAGSTIAFALTASRVGKGDRKSTAPPAGTAQWPTCAEAGATRATSSPAWAPLDA